MYFSPSEFMDPLIFPIDSLKVPGPQNKNAEVPVFGGHHVGKDCWFNWTKALYEYILSCIIPIKYK